METWYKVSKNYGTGDIEVIDDVIRSTEKCIFIPGYWDNEESKQAKVTSSVVYVQSESEALEKAKKFVASKIEQKKKTIEFCKRDIQQLKSRLGQLNKGQI